VIYSGLFDRDPTAKIQREREDRPRVRFPATFSGEGMQVVDFGGAPVISEAGKQVDGVQRDMGSPGASSSMLISSSSG
jgi:hypothetical protein